MVKGTLSNADRDALRAQSYSLVPVVQIGKNGLTKEVIAQIEKYIKKHRLMKVKLLRSCLEETPKKQVIMDLVKKTNTLLVHHVGFVVVLYRER